MSTGGRTFEAQFVPVDAGLAAWGGRQISRVR